MAKQKSKKDKESLLKNLSALELNLEADTRRAIAVVIFAVLSGVTALSMVGSAGVLGREIDKLFSVMFGVMAYLIPVLLGFIAVQLFRSKPEEDENHPYFRTYFGSFLVAGSISGIIHAVMMNQGSTATSLANQGKAGGYLGVLFAGPLFSAFGFVATALIIVGILVIGIFILFNISPFHLLALRHKQKQEQITVAAQQLQINNMMTEEVEEVEEVTEDSPEQEVEDVGEELEETEEESEPLDQEAIVLEDRKDWKLPPFDLLTENKANADSGNIENNLNIIQKTLSDFGIQVEMGEVNVGPTVTQYTLRPMTGVKLSQIATLQNDLALALAAQSIRMELPIPGKSLVGIEVPNKTKALVRLRETMQTTDFVNNKAKLALALGRDVTGKPMIIDLAKMPHMLIAGSTGTGKSVGINSILISLLYRNTPQDVKFILIDPKRVELNLYNGIPHLLTPAITEPDQAINSLKWVVAEMDRRYRLLAEAGKRNIGEYNEENELPLNYIVVVVDELADLMVVAQAEVESAIVRLAQVGRGAGIHLILATQSPRVDVITGLIKANIMARIAFTVVSAIESRTILDSSGAEKLLGNGDMLFTSAEVNKPKRVQGALIEQGEVKKVTDFFKQQAGAVIYNQEITEKPKKSSAIPGMSGDDSEDDLYEAAKEEVIKAGKASASLLQRRLRVGYARAARLLDILEDKGIIGPGDGAKPREVYGEVPASEKAQYGIEE